MKGKRISKENFLNKGRNFRELVMYNSEVHTYEEAIDAIYIGTGHNELQCEQLAILIDTIGYATIKIGCISELKPIAETIELAGFDVTIY